MPIFANSSRGNPKPEAQKKCLAPAHLAAAQAIEPLVAKLPQAEGDLLVRIFTAVSEMAERGGAGDGRAVMEILTTFVTKTAFQIPKKHYGAKTLVALCDGSPSVWALMARTMPPAELQRRLDSARLALMQG